MEHLAVAGFWRRLAAILIDVIIILAIGLGLSLFFYEQFIQLGPWGKLVGLAIVIPYFTLLNSYLGNGQTLGKRLLNIQVVNSNGQLVGLSTSFFRALFLSLPIIFNGLYLPIEFDLAIFNTILAAIIFLLILGPAAINTYLLICNTGTRKLLHDLFLGTYVVNRDMVPNRKTWPGHFGIGALIAILVMSIPFAMQFFMADNPAYNKLTAIAEEIGKLPGVQKYRTSVIDGNTYVYDPNTQSNSTTTFIAANIFVTSNKTENSALIKEVVRLLLAQTEAQNRDIIAVNLTYGFDIGILRSWQRQRHAFPSAEWKKFLAEEG